VGAGPGGPRSDGVWESFGAKDPPGSYDP
jgi:hypothetical protein